MFNSITSISGIIPEKWHIKKVENTLKKNFNPINKRKLEIMLKTKIQIEKP